MTKTLATALAGALVLVLSACAPEGSVDRGDSWESAREAGWGEVTVVYVPAEGFAYEAADGRLTGVSVEIMREFAAWAERVHGVALELGFVADEDWRAFYGRVRDGEDDAFRGTETYRRLLVEHLGESLAEVLEAARTR